MTRVREEVSAPVYDTYRHLSNGSPVINQTHLVLQSESRCEDEVTPNFRKRIQDGEIINNPCSISRSSENSGGGTYSATYGSTTYSNAGSGSLTQFFWNLDRGRLYPRDVSDSVSDSARLMAEAKLRALSSVDVSTFGFMEDVVELRSTLSYLRDPLASLRKLGRNFEKDTKYLFENNKPKKGRKTTMRQLSDAWLEYRFATTPLVQSVNDLLASAYTAVHRPERRTARGFSEHKHYDSVLAYRNRSSSKDYFRRDLWRSEEVRAGILYQDSNPAHDVLYEYGLRLKDVPHTLWAVSPYSWMIDRCFDVTSAIKAVTALSDPSISILAAWTVTKKSYEHKTKFVDQVQPPYTIFVDGDEWVKKDGSYNRQVWHPTLADAVPTPNLGGLVADAKSIADIAALVTNSFGGNKIPRSWRI